MRLASAVAVVAAFVLAAPALAGAQVDLDRLQVEKKAEPVGIDVDRPRFSWIVESRARGVEQRSYRLKLTENDRRGRTVWDSGVVHSPESANVEYGGPPLAAAGAYTWEVRVTTSAGTATARSTFRTGLYDGDDWAGSTWIGNARADQGEALTLEGASWIWTPEASDPPPAEDRAFRATRTSPAGKTATERGDPDHGRRLVPALGQRARARLQLGREQRVAAVAPVRDRARRRPQRLRGADHERPRLRRPA